MSPRTIAFAGRYILPLALTFACYLQSLPAEAQNGVDYVVVINVDALHAEAVAALGPQRAPNLWRFRTEGAYTDNARTDYNSTVTTPNHTTIFTGRRVYPPDGHLWGENTADPLSRAPSIHHPHSFTPQKRQYAYVASVFDVVHDHGLHTALYHQKHRLDLHTQSYNDTYGAPDLIGEDNGRNKIDSAVKNFNPTLVTQWIAAMRANPFHFTYIHFAEADNAGHRHTWSLDPNSDYLAAVMRIDGYVGAIFELIESDPRFAGKTVLLLTADHGGDLGGTAHNTITDIDNYRIPFYAWGPGIPTGGDLYQMNPQYTDPGVGRPDNSDPDNQPIRHGDVTNLVLALLDLPPIPGSHLNADQSLRIMSAETSPCGMPNYDPNREAAVFIWADCATGLWHIRGTAGGAKSRYIGQLNSSAAFSGIRAVSIENNDVFDTSNPNSILFDFIIWSSWHDGFDFRFPQNAQVCFQLESGGAVLVGSSKTSLVPPFSLPGLGACGQ